MGVGGRGLGVGVGSGGEATGDRGGGGLLLAGCAAAGDLFFPGPSCAQAGVGTNWLSDRQRLQDGRYVDWGGLVKEDGAAARWDGGNDAMGYTPAAEIF